MRLRGNRSHERSATLLRRILAAALTPSPPNPPLEGEGFEAAASALQLENPAPFVG